MLKKYAPTLLLISFLFTFLGPLFCKSAIAGVVVTDGRIIKAATGDQEGDALTDDELAFYLWISSVMLDGEGAEDGCKRKQGKSYQALVNSESSHQALDGCAALPLSSWIIFGVIGYMWKRNKRNVFHPHYSL